MSPHTGGSKGIENNVQGAMRGKEGSQATSKPSSPENGVLRVAPGNFKKRLRKASLLMADRESQRAGAQEEADIQAEEEACRT